jgi:hypothetical protein
MINGQKKDYIMNSNKILQEQLSQLLKSGNAHATFDQAIADFPINKINSLVDGISFSCWQLLEHIRIAQWDILDFTKNPNYKTMKFPDDYWPDTNKVATEADWKNTINFIRNDRQEFIDLINNSNTDFFTPIPHAKDYTIFREILVAADHNAYHIGQLVLLRKALGVWK